MSKKVKKNQSLEKTEIKEFLHTASGIGGSYTKWQGKPPAHIELWVYFTNDDHYVGDFHYRAKDGELEFAGIVDQITTDYPWESIPRDKQLKIKKAAKKIAEKSGFFDV